MYNDYEMVANEVRFRNGSGNATAYDVQEVLMYGRADNLEDWEVAAIKQEAAAEGIY